MRLTAFAAGLAAIFACASPTLAKSPEEVLREAFSNSLEGGVTALASMPKAEAAASAALGVARFTRGIERFAQAMYRHGLRPGGRSAAPLLLGMICRKATLIPSR